MSGVPVKGTQNWVDGISLFGDNGTHNSFGSLGKKFCAGFNQHKGRDDGA